LEREPVLLQLLYRVVVVAAEPLVDPQIPLSMDELRMTTEIFSRSFAHVLKHDDADDMKLHRKQSLDAAVDKAIERLDRRRSDQYFVNWVNNGGLAPEDNLPRMYLQITSED